jgi:hypothetical protein
MPPVLLLSTVLALPDANAGQCRGLGCAVMSSGVWKPLHCKTSETACTLVTADLVTADLVLAVPSNACVTVTDPS